MYNNKLKAIVLPVVIALAIVLGMGINSLLDHKEVPVNMGQRMIGSKLDYILNMINYSMWIRWIYIKSRKMLSLRY